MGLLRWAGDAPLRLPLPGLGPPGQLRLRLLAECSGVLELRADDQPLAELTLAPRWATYELAPAVGGSVLGLAWASGSPSCPVHLSAVRTTTVLRRSSSYPRYWIVRTLEGRNPPPAAGVLPWAVGAVLLASVAGAALAGPTRLASWLRLVAPGAALLALVEGLSRVASARLLYPPASFPALLLAPGLLLLAWRHRRAIRDRVRTPAEAAARALVQRPVLVLSVLTILCWAWILPRMAERAFDGDLRGLVHFGTRFDSAAPFPGVPTAGLYGYDGQFYAVLATDPFLSRPETLERMDAPSFRANRILVPLLAWILALGRPEVALWTYIGLCWLLSLAAVPLVARWLEEQGSSGWWAALLVLNAGLAVTMLRVTLDGAALCFLLVALTAHRRDRTAAAAGAATAAALTREVFLLTGLALAAVEVWRRRWWHAAALGLPPALALGLWHLRVAAVTEPSARPFAAIFALPFRWVPAKLADLGTQAERLPESFPAEVAGLVALALALAAAARLLPRLLRDAAIGVLVGFAGLALFLSGDVYQAIDGYARILVPLPVLCVGLSGDPALAAPLRWWLRAVALASALAGYWVVRGAI